MILLFLCNFYILNIKIILSHAKEFLIRYTLILSKKHSVCYKVSCLLLNFSGPMQGKVWILWLKLSVIFLQGAKPILLNSLSNWTVLTTFKLNPIYSRFIMLCTESWFLPLRSGWCRINSNTPLCKAPLNVFQDFLTVSNYFCSVWFLSRRKLKMNWKRKKKF